MCATMPHHHQSLVQFVNAYHLGLSRNWRRFLGITHGRCVICVDTQLLPMYRQELALRLAALLARPRGRRRHVGYTPLS